MHSWLVLAIQQTLKPKKTQRTSHKNRVDISLLTANAEMLRDKGISLILNAINFEESHPNK